MGMICYYFIAPILAAIVGSTMSLVVFGALSFYGSFKLITSFRTPPEPEWLVIIGGVLIAFLFDRLSKLVYPLSKYPELSRERSYFQALGIGTFICSIIVYFT